MRPELEAQLNQHWPDALSGLCAFEAGLSGGLDSVALLSLLCELRAAHPSFQLSAVHVHHGLSPHADEWAEHCRALCALLDVPLRVERVQLTVAGGESLEAVAREARYEVYRHSAADVIALAHHLDDQAETVLLQLLRGGGVRALAAMPAVRALGDKALWRPLLGHTRTQLEDYVRERGLAWVEDESNADTRYRRNLLRHEILPRIEAAVPQYRKQLARAAALMADAASLIDEVAAADLAACRSRQGLDFETWRSLSAARQRQVLLAWLRKLGWSAPEPAALAEFQRQLLAAGAGAQPLWRRPEGELLRFDGHLYALLGLPAPQAADLHVCDPNQTLAVPEWGGALSWEWRERGLPEACLQNLSLRPRAGGEKLSCRIGHRPVKDLLREAGLPPALRRRWPLLYANDGELLAIPGIAVAFQSAAGEGWWPEWRV